MALEQAAPKHGVGASYRRPAEYLRTIARLGAGPDHFWWSARWPWDARAAGLVAFSEKGLIPNRKADTNNDVVEVAPALVDLKITKDARRYYVRPMPGQTEKTYETGIEHLKVRWRCHSISVARDISTRPGRGLFVITAFTGDALDQPLER